MGVPALVVMALIGGAVVGWRLRSSILSDRDIELAEDAEAFLQDRLQDGAE